MDINLGKCLIECIMKPINLKNIIKYIKKYIKRWQKRELINKKVLQRIIKESNLCQHAIRELKLAGYGNGEDGPNDWIYEQVLEALAVFTSHSNSGSSAPWEINLVQKLCSWDVISPLRFTNDEWNRIDIDGTCQNKRKAGIFKESNGDIHYIDAFSKRPTRGYSFTTKEWTKNENPVCWYGGLFEHKDNILTGRYFRKCYLWSKDVSNGWMPKSTRIIDCVEVEIAPDNWIMAVDSDNIDLLSLSCDYNIQWKDCPCMKDVRLEDVTPELEEKAFKEMYI